MDFVSLIDQFAGKSHGTIIWVFDSIGKEKL
jgi:hypothetical protein